MSITLLAKTEPGDVLDVRDLTEDQADQLVRTLHDAMRFDLLQRCPWRDMSLSERARNRLEVTGIDTIDQLIHLTATRLRSISRFGPTVVEEIQAELAQLGLGLKKEQ